VEPKVACEGMSHRFSTWWRALGVVLLSLATVTWPSAAHAGTTPSFSVVRQDAVTRLSASGHARFGVTVQLGSSGATAVAQVSLYPRIFERSQLSPIIDGTGSTGAVTSTSGNFDLGCVSHARSTFTVSLYTSSPVRRSSHCQSRAVRLHLPCSGAACDGVYPLSFTVTQGGVTSTKWSLLAVQATNVAEPLHLALIGSLDPTSWRHPKRAVAVLKALAQHASTPFTLTADYRTLDAAELSTTSQGAAWRSALDKALASPLHRAVAAPPNDVDFSGLVREGLGSQVNQQFALSTKLLQDVTGRYADEPVVLTGYASPVTLKALASAHLDDVVVNDTSLTTSPSSTLNWGAPFHPDGVAPITALSTDAPLERLATDSSIEPGRRATMTLATLAFLHFEEPNAPATRTVVMELPVAKLSANFIDDLLPGLGTNPFVLVSSLTPSFNTSLVGTNGAPASRGLISQPTSTWSSLNIQSLSSLMGQVTSFNQAITSSNVANSLSVAIARAEIRGTSATRQSALTSAALALSTQLKNFSVDQSSITLAGPGTSLPITIISKAGYSVTTVVHLITDRLSFPRGNKVVVTLDSSTKSIRVPTSNHRGSDLTLQVVVTTPNGQLVLARTAIQVRITGTSVVGYLLTIASLLVLGYWWLRTYRRKSKGRHAR